MKRTTAKIPAFDYRRFDPFRMPDWRWTLAQQLHADHSRARRWEDPGIINAARFLKVLNGKGETAARRQWPDLFAAHGIYRGGGVLKDELDARLLVEPIGVISRKMGIEACTVAAFENCFFNVADGLDAFDWLMGQVVCLRPDVPVSEAQNWKYLALAGGPFLLDLMIGDFLGRAWPQVENRSGWAEKGRYIVREFAAGWSSTAAAVIDEGCRRFPHLGRGGESRESRMVAFHLQNLRSFLELEPPPETAAVQQDDFINHANTPKDVPNVSTKPN